MYHAITVRIEKTALEGLDQYVEENDCSGRSEIIRIAIKDFLFKNNNRS